MSMPGFNAEGSLSGTQDQTYRMAADAASRNQVEAYGRVRPAQFLAASLSAGQGALARVGRIQTLLLDFRASVSTVLAKTSSARVGRRRHHPRLRHRRVRQGGDGFRDPVTVRPAAVTSAAFNSAGSHYAARKLCYLS